jgi:hypothetical protein
VANEFIAEEKEIHVLEKQGRKGRWYGFRSGALASVKNALDAFWDDTPEDPPAALRRLRKFTAFVCLFNSSHEEYEYEDALTSILMNHWLRFIIDLSYEGLVTAEEIQKGLKDIELKTKKDAHDFKAELAKVARMWENGSLQNILHGIPTPKEDYKEEDLVVKYRIDSLKKRGKLTEAARLAKHREYNGIIFNLLVTAGNLHEAYFHLANLYGGHRKVDHLGVKMDDLKCYVNQVLGMDGPIISSFTKLEMALIGMLIAFHRNRRIGFVPNGFFQFLLKNWNESAFSEKVEEIVQRYWQSADPPGNTQFSWPSYAAFLKLLRDGTSEAENVVVISQVATRFIVFLTNNDEFEGKLVSLATENLVGAIQLRMDKFRMDKSTNDSLDTSFRFWRLVMKLRPTMKVFKQVTFWLPTKKTIAYELLQEIDHMAKEDGVEPGWRELYFKALEGSICSDIIGSFCSENFSVGSIGSISHDAIKHCLEFGKNELVARIIVKVILGRATKFGRVQIPGYLTDALDEYVALHPDLGTEYMELVVAFYQQRQTSWALDRLLVHGSEADLTAAMAFFAQKMRIGNAPHPNSPEHFCKIADQATVKYPSTKEEIVRNVIDVFMDHYPSLLFRLVISHAAESEMNRACKKIWKLIESRHPDLKGLMTALLQSKRKEEEASRMLQLCFTNDPFQFVDMIVKHGNETNLEETIGQVRRRMADVEWVVEEGSFLMSTLQKVRPALAAYPALRSPYMEIFLELFKRRPSKFIDDLLTDNLTIEAADKMKLTMMEKISFDQAWGGQELKTLIEKFLAHCQTKFPSVFASGLSVLGDLFKRNPMMYCHLLITFGRPQDLSNATRFLHDNIKKVGAARVAEVLQIFWKGPALQKSPELKQNLLDFIPQLLSPGVGNNGRLEMDTLIKVFQLTPVLEDSTCFLRCLTEVPVKRLLPTQVLMIPLSHLLTRAALVRPALADYVASFLSNEQRILTEETVRLPTATQENWRRDASYIQLCRSGFGCEGCNTLVAFLINDKERMNIAVNAQLRKCIST